MFKDKLLTSIRTDTQMLASSLFKLFPCCNPQKWCMSRKNISCNLKLVPTAIVLLHVLSFVNIWERLQDRRSPPSAFPQAHPSGCGSICAVLQWLAGDAEHGHMCHLTSSSVGRSALSLCLIGCLPTVGRLCLGASRLGYESHREQLCPQEVLSGC